MELLKQLLTGSIRRENYQPSPAGDWLLRQGFAEFHAAEGHPDIVFFAITPKGRAACAAQLNRTTDHEDAKEDNQIVQADPGPVVRMAKHIKEAGMVAFRFGVNSVRAQQPNAVTGTKEALKPTLQKALSGTDEAIVEAIANYLIKQIDKGVEAGSK